MARRARREKSGDLAISSIVAHEPFFGAFKSGRKAQNVEVIDALRFDVVAFDKEDARAAAVIRAEFAAEGRPIGPYDVLVDGAGRGSWARPGNAQHPRVRASCEPTHRGLARLASSDRPTLARSRRVKRRSASASPMRRSLSFAISLGSVIAPRSKMTDTSALGGFSPRSFAMRRRRYPAKEMPRGSRTPPAAPLQFRLERDRRSRRQDGSIMSSCASRAIEM